MALPNILVRLGATGFNILHALKMTYDSTKAKQANDFRVLPYRFTNGGTGFALGGASPATYHDISGLTRSQGTFAARYAALSAVVNEWERTKQARTQTAGIIQDSGDNVFTELGTEYVRAVHYTNFKGIKLDLRDSSNELITNGQGDVVLKLTWNTGAPGYCRAEIYVDYGGVTPKALSTYTGIDAGNSRIIYWSAGYRIFGSLFGTKYTQTEVTYSTGMNIAIEGFQRQAATEAYEDLTQVKIEGLTALAMKTLATVVPDMSPQESTTINCTTSSGGLFNDETGEFGTDDWNKVFSTIVNWATWKGNSGGSMTEDVAVVDLKWVTSDGTDGTKNPVAIALVEPGKDREGTASTNAKRELDHEGYDIYTDQAMNDYYTTIRKTFDWDGSGTCPIEKIQLKALGL